YPEIRQPVADEFTGPPIRQPAVDESDAALPPDNLLRISWTHIIELIWIDDPLKRGFYEIECLRGNWSVRQLRLQKGSLLYERTGLLTDKRAVIDRADRQEPPAKLRRNFAIRTCWNSRGWPNVPHTPSRSSKPLSSTTCRRFSWSWAPDFASRPGRSESRWG